MRDDCPVSKSWAYVYPQACRARALFWVAIVVEGNGFVFQHHWDAITNRESQFVCAAGKKLTRSMALQRAFANRANQQGN